MASTKKVVFEVADDYMEFEIGDLTNACKYGIDSNSQAKWNERKGSI